MLNELTSEEALALKEARIIDIKNALENNDSLVLMTYIQGMHFADLADIIGYFPDYIPLIVSVLGEQFEPNVLMELDKGLLSEVIQELPKDTLNQIIQNFDTDELVYLFEELPNDQIRQILTLVDEQERQSLQLALTYPEDSAGRLMNKDIAVVYATETVLDAIKVFKTIHPEGSLEGGFDMFVIDKKQQLLGVVSVQDLLRNSTEPNKPIKAFMSEAIHSVDVTTDQQDVAYLFQQYKLLTVPVLNKNKKLVGAIYYDTLLEIIQTESNEDILKLGGVGEEEISDSAYDKFKKRFLWLLVNLGTSFISSSVIRLREDVLENAVLLAGLLPIVASIGGNAGVQTLTVTVRSLGLKELRNFNSFKTIVQEGLVGLINGLVMGIIVGCVVGFIYQDVRLSLVIALSMLLNLIMGSVFGIIIPIALNRFKIDPAIASSIFVTMITDTVGFLSVLTFASWLLLT